MGRAPVRIWGIAHQSGVSAVQSDLSGGSGLLSHRNQFFLTSGFYHRPLNGTGLQFGGCLDYMHDDWYVKMDLAQIRAESVGLARFMRWVSWR